MDWLSNVGNIVLVVLGIGGVIFVHECGHFFAARWCGVRVDVFSLGFGPRLLGFRRGATSYQLALLPIGGFVKMAGEEGTEGRGPAPDELPAKSVGQRFLIYSGGVIANVTLGLVVFPILLAHGVPFDEPLIGGTTPGGPAWNAGIEPGSTVRSVNGERVASFTHIATEVALGSPERAELELVDPHGVERVLNLVPTYDEDLGVFTLGIQPGVDRRGRIEVAPGSAAEQAGLRSGDQLLGVEGGLAGLELAQQLEFASSAGGTIHARLEREGRAFEAQITPQEPPAGEAESTLLGIMPLSCRVAAVRESARTHATGLAPDDRLLRVAGRRIARPYDLLRALSEAGSSARFEFERQGEPRSTEVTGLDAAAKLELWSAIAVLADMGDTRVAVLPGSAAERAGLRDGDRVLKLDGAELRQYSELQAGIQRKPKGEAAAMVVERVGEQNAKELLEIAAVPGGWRPRSYGFGVQPAEYIYQVSGFLPALREGWRASWKFLEEGWLTLKRILNRQVSGKKAVGGIITIGVVSHRFAESGLASLLFFLCTLSMNLAFLNVLPIPVLDGGHLFFLLVEKIKGSPVSEKVLGYSQMVGIVLILSLMVYVTFNDVMRWIVKS